MLQTFLIAGLLLCSGIAPAHAGFLVPLIIPALAGTLAGTIISGVVSIAASIGLSFLANKLLGRTEQQQPDPGGVQIDTRADADVPQSVLFGRCVTGGSRIAPMWTYGKRGDIDNSDMIEMIAFADHPVSGLVQLYVESQPVSLENAPEGVPEIVWGLFAGGRGSLVSGYNGKLAIKFFDGTQTVADAFAVAAIGGHPERPWNSAMVGRGRSYMRAHYIYDKEKMTGPVRFRAVIDGIKLYDPRKDTTVGGSGSHRFGDLDTHEFTRNLAVIAYNILRGVRVKDSLGTPRHFYGIENGAADSCPLDSWFAAMNECDATIEGEPQFWGGAEIALATPPLDAIRSIVKACDGRFTEAGGVYKLRVGPPGLPVLTFDDGSLRANEGDDFRPILPLEQRINYVTGTYTAPEDGWISKVAPPRTDDDMIEADGRRLDADLDVPWVQSPSHMQRLQKQMLLKSRKERRHTIPLPPAAFGLEPGDHIEWNSERNGYVEKLFEVESVDWHPNLDVTASIIEVDHDDYDWVEDDDYIPQPVGSLVADRPAPKIIDGFDAAGAIHAGANGIERAAIRVTWDLPEDGDLAEVEVQVRRSALIPDAATFTTNEPAAGEMLILAAITPGTAYQVRGRYVSFNGFETEWSLWIDVTTPDVRIVQSELSKQLDATVRQVNERLQPYLDDIRRDVDAVSQAQNGNFHTLQERAGRILMAVGARYLQNKASATLALQAAADVDGALAALIATVFATGPGGSAEGKFRVIADSTVAGAAASIGLEVNASDLDTPAWRAASLFLDAMATYSRIRMLADQFVFQVPGVNGGDPFTPFQVSGSEVLINTLLRAQGVVADSIRSDDIQGDGAVYVRENSVGGASHTFANNTTTHVTLVSKTVNVARGNPCILFGEVGVNAGGTFNDWYDNDVLYADILWDGSPVKRIGRSVRSGGGAGPGGVNVNDDRMYVVRSPSIGSHTVAIRISGQMVFAVGNPSRSAASTGAALMFLEPTNKQGP